MKEWIKPWLRAHAKKATSVLLAHVSVTGATTRLHTVDDVTPENLAADEWLDARIEELAEAAAHHTATWPSRQHKFMVAIQAGDRIVVQRGFNATTAPEELGIATESEAPGVLAALSMQMRHNQHLINENAKLANVAIAASTIMAEELGARRVHEDKLFEKTVGWMDAYARLQRLEVDGELERARALKSGEQKDRLVKQIERVVPFVLERVTGVGAVAEFFDELTETEQKQLLTFLEEKPHLEQKFRRILKQQQQFDREKAAPSVAEAASSVHGANGTGNGKAH